MNRYFADITKGRSETSFLSFGAIVIAFISILLSASLSLEAKNNQKVKNPLPNSFMTPDFAFPKDVDATASLRLEKALKEKNGSDALRAAIQIDIARSLVSSTSFKASAERFDSIAALLLQPWSNLSLMLEALMYKQYYQKKSHIFNRRSLPASPRPENVDEWSGEMFRDKILELVAESLENSENLSHIPINDIKGVLTDYKEAGENGFSVLDFLRCQAVDILSTFISQERASTIPFDVAVKTPDNSPEAVVTNLINECISGAAADGNQYKKAFFCKMLLDRYSGDRRKQFAKECLDEFRDTPYCSPFIIAYCNSLGADRTGNETANEIRREKYNLARDYYRRFPDAPGIGEIQQLLGELTRAQFTVSLDNRQLLPGVTSTIEIESSNVSGFYVMVYRLADSYLTRNLKYTELRAKGRAVLSLPVKTPVNTPDIEKCVIELPGLDPGVYAVAISTDGSDRELYVPYSEAQVNKLLVSDLTSFCGKKESEKETELYIVSAVNGAPQMGLTVEFNDRDKQLGATTAVTDADGKVKVPVGATLFRVKNPGNGCMLYSYVSGQYYYSRQYDNVRGSIMTDLSIYRPGDTVKFAVMAWRQKGHTLSALENQEFEVVLRDANYQPVDTLAVSTDRFGRAPGEFRVPESGLLGSWTLNFQRSNIGGNICSQNIEVAEYKSPTFLVETSSTDKDFVPGNLLTFRGKATTYAGMPVAGAKVEYQIDWRPFRFFYWGGGDQSSYSGTAETDADGNFKIELETAGLKNTRYERGIFDLKVSVTNQAGETQESVPYRFAIGNDYVISADITSRIEAHGETVSMKVKVTDALGNKVDKTVYYRVTRNGETLKTGETDNTEISIPSSALPSGEYKFKFSLDPRFDDKEEGETAVYNTAIWRRSDKTPAEKTIIWIDDNEVSVPAETKQVKIRVGSSYQDSHVLANYCDNERLLGSEWKRINDGFIILDVPAPASDQRVFVHLTGVRDLDMREATVTLVPVNQTTPLKAEVVTFRDKIEPGARETWKFRFTVDSQNAGELPVMAVMSNKALNALQPFSWNFNPYALLSWSADCSFMLSYPEMVSLHGYFGQKTNYSRSSFFAAPDWQTYGYSLAGNKFGGPVMMNAMKLRSSKAEANGMEMDAAVPTAAMDMAVAEDAVVEETAALAGNANAEQNKENGQPIREVECASAFFMAGLVADADGVATVEFEAPQFIGTWQFQILGYSPDMKGTVMTLDAVSSKKVMAQMTAPRFVRTGDKLYVSATIFNNSGATAEVSGRIEILNPLTGEVLASYASDSEELDDLRSRVITASVDVPVNIEALQIRVYGTIPGYSDGEQTIIPVLPSSTPLIESTPFYLQPSQKDFTIKLPQFDDNAEVTLTYCDNPIWECVTALPDILKPESVSILSQAYALFGNCIADGLFRRYPNLIEAVKTMAADSTLVSPLEKNPQLKSVLLNNTPWVNNASAESLRMQNLVKYADPQKARQAIDEILKTLRERQTTDGGWSWCPDMQPSLFITECVFFVFGSLQNLGYLPAEADAMALKAGCYIEEELLKQWRDNKYKYYSLSGAVDFLYSRSAFADFKDVSGFERLCKIILDDIRKNWRKFDLKDKATAALVLDRYGYAGDARKILESILQFASESSEKGMWFDNMGGGWSGKKEIYDLTRILEAFGALEPKNPAVDKMRQWLIMTKQTMDWGDSRFTADAVSALLGSGSDWMNSAESPVITLGGKNLEIEDMEKITGALTLQLDARQASGSELTISRSAQGPAWGGVVAQYVAPIENVKAVAIPEISIEKQILAIGVEDGRNIATGSDLKVGDRVRVTLTITCDRNLDYVAVTDPRPACLQPSEQLSAYTVSDGLWFYREVRETQTNLFITYLPKGTHVISYECFVEREGEYAVGPVGAQSQYAPTISAHSAGKIIKIGNGGI